MFKKRSKRDLIETTEDFSTKGKKVKKFGTVKQKKVKGRKSETPTPDQGEGKKEKREKKGRLKLGIDVKSKKINEEGSDGSETKLTYNTTLIDRLSKKITFESLDISSNFSIHEDTAFAKGGYVRVYNIIKYPAFIYYNNENAFISTLLNSLKNKQGFETGVDLYFESFNKPYKINFDQKTKRRYEGLERMEKTLLNEIQSNSKPTMSSRDREISQLSGDALTFRLTEVQKKRSSYDLIRGNQSRGRTQLESFQFIRVVCQRKDMIQESEKELISLLRGVDVQIKKVKNLTEYFETFSPVSGLYNLNLNNDYASTIFTSQGYSKLRDKPTRILENELAGLSRLIYVGTEVGNLEPLGLTFTSSGEGQNILIVGTTGSGKTYMYENLMMNAALNGFKINAMDYKGNEYANIATILPETVTLDFSSSASNFINTLKFIPELYDPEDLKGAFIRNSEATVQSLRVLAGVSKDNIKSAESALEDMVRKIYSEHHVHFQEPHTYFKSRDINYFRAISEAIQAFQSDRMLHEIFGVEVCRQLFTGLTPYFSEGSYKSSMFSTEIDLKAILNKDCIIYSFNMNQDSAWDSLVEYKIFIQDYVTNMFVQRNKRAGFSTLNSIEEYQRAVRHEDSRRIYNNKFSGGRSDNVINVIMTNTIRPLLDKSLDTSAVRENVATLFVGKIKDRDVLDDFCRTFGMNEGGKEKILRLQKMKHSFYVDYDTGVQQGGRIIRVIHTPEITKFFETKDIDQAEG